jgi:hypothetical protein
MLLPMLVKWKHSLQKNQFTFNKSKYIIHKKAK